jgi:hypothetical protein
MLCDITLLVKVQLLVVGGLGFRMCNDKPSASPVTATVFLKVFVAHATPPGVLTSELWA